MEDEANEETHLVTSTAAPRRRHIKSTPATPTSRGLSRQHSVVGSFHKPQLQTGTQSWSLRIGSGANATVQNGLRPSRTVQSLAGSLFQDDRVWYDQFTSTDWVHDSIADGHRTLQLQQRKDIRGRLWYLFDGAQGWFLVAFIGCVTALIAFLVDVTESAIFDIKEGFCQSNWHTSHRRCPPDDWQNWSQIIRPSSVESKWIDFVAFIAASVILAVLSCLLTLQSKTVVPAHIASTMDENLGAIKHIPTSEDDKHLASPPNDGGPPAITYYSAAGSGVAEVRVILSGFVLHGYLGVKTLVIKTIGLVLSVASGMSLGKEGPFVHIATCVGNIACRPFTKYSTNDGKRREILSAAAASGVAVSTPTFDFVYLPCSRPSHPIYTNAYVPQVAFGAPIGGVLFSLEEVSYYFPSKTLFRTFFCCIAAALSLKFLNPYGTSKIVIFEVRYVTDWRFFELFNFAFLGIAGGLLGALFIKASRWWATTFRRIEFIKTHPVAEVAMVALITGLVSFWNRYTKLAVTELLFELAAPCDKNTSTGLCPEPENIPKVIRYLLVAFVIKAGLTVITFGIKVPAGIYVPSMVVGGLMGRIAGHTMQWIVMQYSDFFLFSTCPAGGIESCVVPGVYALVAAGATMCGVTRLSVTLAVILFELTGSLDHVLPFSLGVMFAKWTADAVEPLSIYDLLTQLNNYPYLENKVHPVFDTELGDITTRTRRTRLVDITLSPLVPAIELREKLTVVQASGELDGGLPVVRDGVLYGLLPVPDLEWALDRIDDETTALCLMVGRTHRAWSFVDDSASADFRQAEEDAVDLLPYIDMSPIALDIHSPMDLVYQCFVKLGLRYICVVSEGRFVGMLHKKAFVRYVKEMEEQERART